MGNDNAADTAIEFIEKINRRDFKGLGALMTPDFLCITEGDGEARGRTPATVGIKQYTLDWPDFQIYISDVYVDGGTVSIVGRTTGSCDEDQRGTEIRRRRLYQVTVENGLATSFRFVLPDTETNRTELGMLGAKRITE